MSYDEHLDRALEESPDVASHGSRFSVPEPEMRQEGNVTIYENFQETLDRLNRDLSHVRKFLQNEFGTSANIDDRGRLRLTGSFKQDRVQAAIDAYVEGFVTCNECGSPDTYLVTENGVELIQCDACGARSATGT